MKKATLFAMEVPDVEQARLAVESALKAKLDAHQSDYHGRNYYRGNFSGAGLILQENFIEDDGEPTEAEFPSAKLLLYVEGVDSDVDSAVAALSVSGCVKEPLRSSVY
jgi:hypothetical protein